MTNYLIYLALSLVLLAAGIVISVITTRNKEFTLISQGNKAAAIVVFGRTVGLATILCSAIANSISLFDLAIWAGIAIITQIIANFLAEILTPTFNIADAIDSDNIAVAITLAGMFISIGLIIAGCLTY